MASYRELTKWIKAKYGFVSKSCWIARVKSDCGLVMRRVAWMLAAGTVAGIMLTIFARRIIGIIIYFEARREAGGLVVIALLLVVVGLLAALIPAARAASVEPMQALRTE